MSSMSGTTTRPGGVPARPLRLIATGVLAALLIGGGLAVLAFAAAVSLATWITTRPEPATILFGDSMPPTLQDFDVVYLRPAEDLRRGDIIFYLWGDSRISHRIIGLPGETVEVEAGTVYVGRDGARRALAEPYVVHRAALPWDAPAVTLDAGQYLTLGDNRAQPSGRAVQIVGRADILGVLYRVVFPPWRARVLEPSVYE